MLAVTEAEGLDQRRDGWGRIELTPGGSWTSRGRRITGSLVRVDQLHEPTTEPLQGSGQEGGIALIRRHEVWSFSVDGDPLRLIHLELRRVLGGTLERKTVD